ncbi:efflux RND transporter periplasmic adaptor subunit [Chloracidobacterium validum]|uniref:Efflux RND transporter periplasmic adaptor subunit n=1 Tax=Chloracidobacterium validum TaxID=2821543 RepID=A0ABX8BCE5_9BACT|nr:efflux RND transporter periplasmic adaptor subunit [Chloracidobacterium validum]QUW04082.1 efflux RND transporter periplasmic adaptor subunit [Chloracidobacterium validum]
MNTWSVINWRCARARTSGATMSHVGRDLLLGMTLIGLLLGTACTGDLTKTAQGSSGPPPAPRLVKLTQVSKRQVERVVTALGTLSPFEQATLRVKVPGRLQTIAVDLGTAVKAGQVVACIEPDDYRLRVQQAEAALAQSRARLGLPADGNHDRVDPEQTGTVRQAKAVLEQAQADRERNQALFEQGIISRSQLDVADAAYKVALSRYQDALEEINNRLGILAQRRSELALAQQQLADTEIVAPFGGVVQERLGNIGEFLTAGSPVATLLKLNPLRLRVEIPEREAYQVKLNQTVRVTVEGQDRIYVGQIKRLSPALAEQNRILIVEAEVTHDGALKPGSFARAEILVNDRQETLTVPTQAIVTFAGIDKVITVRDGKALERPVTLGRRMADWTEIVKGVEAGELIILDPGNVQTGQPVVIQE